MTETGVDSTKNSSETLTRIVKTGAVENYSERGYMAVGNGKAMDIIALTWVDDKLGLSKKFPDSEGYTNLALVPLSSPDVAKKLDKSLSNKDVAVCMAYYAKEIDRSKRSGNLRAVVIMSENDGKQFVDAVKDDPGLVYQLVRHVNGGPIKMFDGNPADIKPGNAVEILPNNKVGGNMLQKIQSVPFQPDFRANS